MFTGKVNQKTIDPFDSTEEGYRNFILFAFHPSVTDTMGTFHMLRQFLVILDSILSKDGNTAPVPNVGVGENTLPPPMEQLVPNGFGLNWSYFNGIKEYIYPRKSPLEFLSGLSEDLGITHCGLKMEKYCNKELLDECKRGNRIASLWLKCQAK